MKKSILLVAILLGFLLLINFSDIFRALIISPFLGAKNVSTFEEYITLHGEFSAGEDNWKGSSVEGIKKMHGNYLRCHPTSKDLQLYRTFKMQPEEFWNWLNYFTHPRYKLPYIEKKQILYAKRPPTICPELYPDDEIDIK